MQHLEVKLYNLNCKTIWDNFVLSSNQKTFLFQRDFIDYHSDRFEDYSLMIYKEGNLIALLPANRVESQLFSHQGLTYGGFIYQMYLKSKDAIEIFKAVSCFLNQRGILKFTIKELPHIFLYNPVNNPFAYLYFKVKAQLKRMDSHSVLDIKFKNYSRSRVNGYKRGLRNNLIVEETNDFTTFWNTILTPNLDHKHSVKPVHTLEEIQFLKSKFPKRIRQFNVYNNDEIVAGTTIFETEHVAHSQYISGDENKNTLGSLDVLHHYLIEEVFTEKPYFNFGISNINMGHNINEGLLYWKEGFGARSITQGFYEIETKNYKLLEDIFV